MVRVSMSKRCKEEAVWWRFVAFGVVATLSFFCLSSKVFERDVCFVKCFVK